MQKAASANVGAGQWSSRGWLDRELAAFAAGLPDGALVLDAGAGDQRNARHFHHLRYESADFESVDKAYAKSTYVCDLASIPVQDQRFDVVVFTQVMEHLPEPATVLKELHRVLKPGGKLFYSAPLWYQEHEVPYDYYRYTQFGVRHLFSTASFEVNDLHWLEGYMGTVAHQLRLMKKHLPRSPGDYGSGVAGVLTFLAFRLFRLFIPLLHSLANDADSEQRYTGGGLPKNYVAIVTRLP